jgi:RHS repeat-associated protein
VNVLVELGEWIMPWFLPRADKRVSPAFFQKDWHSICDAILKRLFDIGCIKQWAHLFSRFRFPLIILVAYGVIPIGASGQNQPGILPFSTNEFGVDIATGNINVGFPLRSKTGKIPFWSKIVGTSGMNVTPEPQWSPLLLWSYQDPTMASIASSVSSVNITPCPIGTQRYDYAEYLIGFGVTDDSGFAHRFAAGNYKVGQGASGTACGTQAGTFGPFQTTDNSGYTMTIINGALTVTDRRGNSRTGTCSYSNGGCYLGQNVTDVDGASMALGYQQVGETNNYFVTDTLATSVLNGVPALVPGGGPMMPSSGAVSYLDANGATQQYTFGYTTLNLASNFNCINTAGVQEPQDFGPGHLMGAVQKSMLTSITLPGSSGQYTISYEPTPGVSGSYTGRIAKIVLPSGGSVSYVYSGGNQGINCAYNTVPTLTVTVNDNNGNSGTYTYVSSLSTAATATNVGSVTYLPASSFNVTKTDPLNNQTVYTFFGEYQTQVQYFQGSASGTPLKTVTTCYNNSLTNCATPSAGPTLPFTQRDTYTSLGSSAASRVELTYDSYGNVTNERDMDYGNVGSGGLCASATNGVCTLTTTTYGSWTGSGCAALATVLSVPCDVKVENNNTGSVLAETRYTYNSTGHATAVSKWASGSTWLTTNYSYNTTGTIASMTDPKGNVTGYGYAASGSGGCNGLLLTSTTYPLAAVGSSSQTWNCNGAVLASSKDVNGQLTTYTYNDPFWRLTATTYPSGGGATTFNYEDAQNTVVQTVEADPDPAESTTTVADGLGRIIHRHQSDSSQQDTVDTTYDLGGRLYSITNPYRSTSDPTYGLTTYTYDALNRKTLEIEPGRTSQLQWSYSGTSTTSIDESGNSWIRTNDLLGRTINVIEPTGASTKYSYDGLGNLLTVNQLGVTGDTPRIRSFTYDSLSRLISASNPETGTIGYGYDADGNLTGRTDARGITTSYGYDALNRMTTKVASDGSFTYQYMYDISSQTNSIGRLSYESNDVNASGAYNYDAMGRVTSRSYCVPSNCSLSIQAQATYDLAGNMTSQTYPDGRTITQGIDGAGRVSSVTYTGWGSNSHSTPYLTVPSSNGYDPAGHLINATMGNGVGFTASYDNRERVGLLAYGTSNQLLWGKQYGWTPNSSLQTITDASSDVQRWMVYDNLNRLTSAQDLIGSQQGANTSPYPSIPGGWTGSNSGTVAAVPFWTDPDESNLLENSDTPGAEGWIITSASVASGVTAPDGTSTAYNFVASSSASDAYITDQAASQYLFDGETMTGSVWLRSPNGTQTVNLYFVEEGTAGYYIPAYKPVTVTQNWQQFQVSGQFSYGHDLLLFQVGGAGTISNGQTISIWGAKLEDSGTTGPTITNFMPFSQRLTGPTWNGNSTVSDNSAIAPDGTQTAATVTATASDNWVVDWVNNPSPHTDLPIVASVWMRSSTGTQNISVSLLVDGNTPVGTTYASLTSDWQRFQVTTTNSSTLNQLCLQIGGGGTFANGQSIQVWGAQMEMATVAGPYAATAGMPTSIGTNLTNILSYSQQPNAPSWSSTTGGSGVINAVVAPDSSQTGYQFTATGGSGWITNDVTNPALYDNAELTGSIFLRSPNGNESVDFSLIGYSGTTRVLIQTLSAQLTSTWQRFSVSKQAPNGLTRLFLQVGDSFTAGEVVDVWGSQLELSSSAGPYVVTSQLPVVAGKELSNILPNSQQISGPSWAVGNGAVTANNLAAPDGSSTATTVTANSGSPDTYIDNFVPNPSLYDGQTVTGSVYLRVPSGSLNTYLYLYNVGASGTAVPNVGVTITTAWQRFTITQQLQNGLTSLALQIGGATTFTSGSVQIWGAQMVLGGDAAPYMQTTSAASNPVNGQAATPVPNGLNQTFTYDSFGNLKQNGGFNNVFTPQNQLFGYAYDPAGNLLSNGLTTMTWDAESKLITAGGATYVYDPEGNRVEKQGAGITDTINFGGRPIARYSGGAWTDLIYGPNSLLAEVGGSETASPNYRIVDHLGNQVGTVGNTILLTNPMDYTPFGQVFEGSTNDPYMFTAKERDAESGNDYFGARYYASSMGRFMSPDPSQLVYADQTNPQSLNLYSYVRNNPLINTDPSGLECVWDDGSYDSNDDPDTGSYDKCQGPNGAGGTWVDHSFFQNAGLPDWTPDATSPAAQTALGLANLVTTCTATILSAMNQATGGDGFTQADVTGNFQWGGAVNIDVTATNLSPNQFNATQPTRYLPSGFVGAMTGLGPSVHLPAGPGNGSPSQDSPQTVPFSNSNVGGTTTVTTSAHVDSALSDPAHPIGAAVHYTVDVRGAATRNPCP